MKHRQLDSALDVVEFIERDGVRITRDVELLISAMTRLTNDPSLVDAALQHDYKRIAMRWSDMKHSKASARQLIRMRSAPAEAYIEPLTPYGTTRSAAEAILAQLSAWLRQLPSDYYSSVAVHYGTQRRRWHIADWMHMMNRNESDRLVHSAPSPEPEPAPSVGSGSAPLALAHADHDGASPTHDDLAVPLMAGAGA